jgi:hypothetical protein
MRRPEQDKTEHDSSDIFLAPNAKPSSPVFKGQAKEGKNSGFNFYRDPLNAEMPNQSPDAIMKQLETDRPKVMDAQRKLLEGRYDLTPKLVIQRPECRAANRSLWVRRPASRAPSPGIGCLR